MEKIISILLFLLLFCLPNGRAEVQTEPNLAALQAEFDRGHVDSDALKKLRLALGAHIIQAVTLDGRCKIKPVIIGIFMQDGRRVPAFGLRLTLHPAGGTSPRFTIDPSGKIHIERIMGKNFPMRIEIPLLGYKVVLRNPARSLNSEDVVRLVRTCGCEADGYGLLLKYLTRLRGTEIINVAVTKPQMVDLKRITPLSVSVSLAIAPVMPLRGLRVRVTKRGGPTLSSTTDDNGRALFNRIAIRDFPLRIDMPLIDRTIKINPPDVSGILKTYFDKANDLQKHGNYEKAIEIYSSLISIKRRAPFLNNRGRARYLIGDKAGALKDYGEAIRINSRYAAAFCNRGVLLFSKNRIRDALRDLNAAIRIEPRNAEYFFSRGLVYEKQKMFDKALSDFTRAIALNPSLALAYFNRGIVYYKKSQYGNAISDLNAAIELAPRNAKAYYLRGSARWLMGRESKDENLIKSGMSDLRKADDMGCKEARILYRKLSGRK